MNAWLLFLLKSTLILSVLYLFFCLLIKKETFFFQSRITLLLIVFCSLAIPFVNIPGSNIAIVPDKIESPLINQIVQEYSSEEQKKLSLPSATISSVLKENQTLKVAMQDIVFFVYLIGVFISLGLFVFRLKSVLNLIEKSPKKELDGIKLVIVKDDIPAFSFGSYIVISSNDYRVNSRAILIHELSHIKQGHFYDLMVMELMKVFYWFNPLVYFMNGDMKEIHEYQADQSTIRSGIDAINYQLLIIQKSVGHQKFALANSFNHCQIKNRITMMNKSKNRKSWNWKVATFLPLLIILLMAFGRKGENPPDIPNYPVENPSENIISSAEKEQHQYDEFKQKIEIRMDGNYINNKKCSLLEIKELDRKWREASNDWIFLLIDESVPFQRIDEVRESLEGSYWVVQSTVDSDDPVYFAGDVNKLAEFKQGKLGDWINIQLSNYPEAKSLIKTEEFTLVYSFIIDKHGKVRDGHITKACEFPEINEAYEKILVQIPDWKPAMRGNEEVSVYNKIGCKNKVVKEK